MGDTNGNNTLTYVLPDVIDPPETVCYVVRVPKNKYHIMAFLGAIKDLAEWWHWERDDAHNATKVALVWWRIWLGLEAQNCGDLGPCAPAGILEDDLMPIRVDCDCHAFITCCDGSEKQLVTTDMINNSSQPGAGSPQPKPGGGTAIYNGCMDASKVWLIPAPLNTGDVVTRLSVSGAWNDPDHESLLWRTADGLQYFAGQEVPGTAITVSTDPLNTEPHMSMVIRIGSTYYPFASGSWTVPAGISNATAVIQANDQVIGDDNGNLCFQLEVTNNQANQWAHDVALALGPNGFAPIFLSSGPLGTWVSGFGLEQTNANDSPSTDYYTGLEMTKTHPATHYTKINFTYDLTLGVSQGTADAYGAYIQYNAGPVYAGIAPGSLVNGSGQVLGNTGDITGVTSLTLGLFSAHRHDATYGGGSCLIYTLHVEGVGFDPWI